eukprot:1188393-Amphidinium_carterae.1
MFFELFDVCLSIRDLLLSCTSILRGDQREFTTACTGGSYAPCVEAYRSRVLQELSCEAKRDAPLFTQIPKSLK